MSLPRAFTRAALFEHVAGRLSFVQSKQVDQALALLRPQERSVLLQAHAGGDRSSVNWRLEEASVDALSKALEIAGYKRRAPNKPAPAEEKSAA